MQTNTFHAHDIDIHPNPTDLKTISFPLTLSSQLFSELSYLNHPVNYPSEQTRPSPFMVYTDILHANYVIDDHSNSIIDCGVTSRRHLWSEIDSIKTTVESILNDFASVGIVLSNHREIINGISQKLTCSPQLSESKEGIFKVVFIVYSVTSVHNYSGGGVSERMFEEWIHEYERRRNYGMVPSATESLAMVKESVKVEEKSSCPICLMDFHQKASAMPCRHMFHHKCIIKWLKQSHYCPVCRFELPSAVS